MLACSTEQLLVFNNWPILLEAPGKNTSKNHPPPPRKLPPFGGPPFPFPSEFPFALRGGMNIFCNYSFYFILTYFHAHLLVSRKFQSHILYSILGVQN